MSFSLPLHLLGHVQLVISTPSSQSNASFELRPLQLEQIAKKSNTGSMPSTIHIRAVETPEGMTFELSGDDSPATTPSSGLATPPEYETLSSTNQDGWQNSLGLHGDPFFGLTPDFDQWLNGGVSNEIVEFGPGGKDIVFSDGFPSFSSLNHTSENYAGQKSETLDPMFTLPNPSPLETAMDTLPTLPSHTSPFLSFPPSEESSTTGSESPELSDARDFNTADGSSSNASSRSQSRSNSPSSSSTSSGTKKRSTQHRPRPFRCKEPGCDRVFTSNYTRETHMLTHRPKQKQTYRCTIGCGALFSRKHDRFRHEVSQHGKPTQWTCTHCAQYFSSEKMLSAHSCDRPLRFQWKPHQSDEQSMIE
ncbi:hypothetical protein WG66_014328 [Moniliophthora roreri]|uniref:C2H2-type domain-containing protein n=1 Tax=Moniliophthora roreri TaxID=221103 RepID=A0A0W0GES7_MONRR|nr:hypothetical protein WG66_014328 [Moniliophthora roreri]